MVSFSSVVHRMVSGRAPPSDTTMNASSSWVACRQASAWVSTLMELNGWVVSST